MHFYSREREVGMTMVMMMMRMARMARVTGMMTVMVCGLHKVRWRAVMGKLLHVRGVRGAKGARKMGGGRGKAVGGGRMALGV
jgi:hypothetical protein